MNWQARVRWLADRCAILAERGESRMPDECEGEPAERRDNRFSDRCESDPADGGGARMFVCGAADKRALYEHAAVQFVPVDVGNPPGEANEDGRVGADGVRSSGEELRRWAMAAVQSTSPRGGWDASPVQLLTPDYGGRLWPTTRRHQRFVSFRRPGAATTDVVLVERRVAHAGERNLSESWWDGLQARLESRGLRVRRCPRTLDAAIEAFSTCRLAAGGSTGGLHLASLCECPHYVWGCGDEARWTGWAMSNRQRYETLWNPLGTPVVYDGVGWRPDATAIADKICLTLTAIGRGDGFARRTAAFRRRWRMRRGLADCCVAQPRAWLPWRARRWLAENTL